jgi:hypothetical protein
MKSIDPSNRRSAALRLIQRCGQLLPLCVLATAGTLLAGSSPLAQTGTPNVVINVDALADRHPINPEIYGVAHASTAILAELNAPLNREGGNNTSRYNWQLNADNRGNDWYYESIAEGNATPGERGDRFITNSRGAGAQAMLTIPTIGWVAKVGASRQKLASFSIAKYGAQTGSDWQWFPDAGNGILQSTGQPVPGNDPNDANVPSDPAFQRGWVSHLVGKWGGGAAGGLKYYVLDNEPSIWHGTHRDVHPVGAGMDEIRDKILSYGAAIKDVDPTAQVVGPEEWGWAGYLYSGYDQQYGNKNGWGYLPDRAAHGGQLYLPWLLDQLRQDEARTGRRLLDVFTVHYYPQGGEFSNDTSSAMQLRRNRSTRSLWDPNYVDETWVNDRVQLLPRLKGWVNTYYPGTRIGITEYNWGAEGHINGATAQADVYGIFGRESLDLANRWTHPDPSTPTFKAMKLYRNYDGQKSTFGDLSVRAAAPSPDLISSFGAVRSTDGALTVMLINKQLSTAAPVSVSLANFTSAGRSEQWQLSSTNAISRLADLSFSGATLTTTLPAQSITLLVIPAGTATAPLPAAPLGLSAVAGNARVDLTWSAATGASSYRVKRSTISGGPYTTVGAPVTSTSYADTAVTNGTTYYYVVAGVNTTGEGPPSAQVSARPVAPAPAPVFGAKSSVTPASIARGKTATFTSTITCSVAPPPTVLVTMRVYDAAGALAGQKSWPNEVFSVGQGRWYGYIWTAPAKVGTYRLQVAVSSADGSRVYFINQNAAAVSVK